jgi:hypothetical protein
MTLPKEWIAKSQELYPIKKDREIVDIQSQFVYVKGATAYKQAVEKAIALEKSCYENPLAHLVLDELLKSLQTLKPTSND